MFMVLQFNVAGESYSSEWLSCKFQKVQKHVGFLELSSQCWLCANISKMCRNVMAQSKLMNDSVAQDLQGTTRICRS